MKVYRVSVPRCQVECDCSSCCCANDEEIIGFYTSAEMAKIVAWDERLAERAVARKRWGKCEDVWKDSPHGSLEERVAQIYVRVAEIEVNEATARETERGTERDADDAVESCLGGERWDP